MEVNCESMAVIGATLANGGTCPTTLDSIIKPEHVRDVLSLLHSCGFYEYSGQFAFKVRLKKNVLYVFVFTIFLPSKYRLDYQENLVKLEL